MSITSLSFFDEGNDQWLLLDTDAQPDNAALTYISNRLQNKANAFAITSEEINYFLYPTIVLQQGAAPEPPAPAGSKLYFGSINILSMAYVNALAAVNSNIEVYFGSTKLFPV